MKTLISSFFILCLSSSSLLSQTNSLDTSFETATSLTDKEMNDAQNFVHQGRKDRLVEEKCKEQGLGKCETPEEKMGIEALIGKAYVMVFGLMGGMGGPTLNLKTPKPEAGAANTAAPEAAAEGAAPPKEQKDTKTDYCLIAAIAYETLGGMIQSNLQKKAEASSAGTSDLQLQALVNLKETHKARKTTATYQGAVYGAVAGCYVGMATMGKAATDWKYWAKLGGATTLSVLYLKKAKKHADAAKKVQVVIDSLPKTGECNPWTGTSCFCKEATSKTRYPVEYQNVCVLNDGDFETPRMAVGCGKLVNNKMQYDEQCKCKQNNSCFNARIRTYNPNFNLGKNFMDLANQGFDLVSSGEFDEAKLGSYSTSAAAQAARVTNPKAASRAPGTNLTPDQKALADELAKTMPRPFANLAAASASTEPPAGGLMGSGAESALSKLPKDLKGKLGEDFSGKYRFGHSGSKANSGNDDVFVMPSFTGQQPEASPGTEILSFAEQALSKADVSNAPQTPIFEIISNRYRRSGWSKLQSDKK